MLFKNKNLQSELERNGFVIIPFLDNIEITELNNFYDSVHNNSEPPNFIENIHMTSWCLDVDYKMKVTSGLRDRLDSAANNYFEGSRTLNHVFIVKRQGDETTFKVHQDWNVVDEIKYQSVNVWFPLHDVDEKSGALWIVKGSHKIKRPIRGAGYLFPDYTKFTKELQGKAISVRLKKGEAIVFYHSVIHGSPPNFKADWRKAACFSIIPKAAPLCIYFQPEKDMPLQVYEPQDDFMFQYKELRKEAHIIPPSGRPTRNLPSYINSPVSRDELNALSISKKGFFSFFKRA